MPVFTGGTGRSGSTIVGHLLDHHPDLTLTRPMEVRFISGNDGILDAVSVARRNPARGIAAAQIAAERIRTRWFERAPDVGLHTSVSLEEINAWVQDYLEGFADDPTAASIALTRRIMDAICDHIDAQRWVDTTPANARKGDRLTWLYPKARVIAVVRDGRDVAASFVAQSFGPDDVFEALDQWGERMQRIHRSLTAAPEGSMLRVDLVDLVVRRRESTLADILDFVGVPESAEMRAWFDGNVTAASAHGGRWRSQFDDRTVREIDIRYRDICGRLTESGVVIPHGD